MLNASFEDGWTDIVTGEAYGWLINQQPVNWKLRWLWPGDKLFGSGDEANGVPECVHKLADQLPPNEQPGGSDPLILDGETTYKLFHNGASFGVELWQVVTGLIPGTEATINVPIRIHDHAKSGDYYAAESGVWLLTEWEELPDNECNAIFGEGYWKGITPDREWNAAGGWSWYYHKTAVTVPDSGSICVLIRVKSKWDQPVDFFVDAIELITEGTDPPEPPPSHELEARVAALENKVDGLEVEMAALSAALAAHTHQPPPPGNLPVISERALAVDVSAHQGLFDWQAAKASGIEYAIIRSSNGLGSGSTDENGRDKQLFRNASECTRLGIPFAIYHYLQPANIAGQISLVGDILVDLAGKGTPPSSVELENGSGLPPVWCDVEERSLNHTAVEDFCDTHGAGIYTSKSIWEDITNGAAVWWMYHNLWIAQWGANDGQIPPETAVPVIPRGFLEVDLWQFTSQGGALAGWSSTSLDVSLTGPFAASPPPPVGDLVNLKDYFVAPADVGYWLVMRKVHKGADVGTIDHQSQLHDGIILRLKGNPAAAEFEEIRANDGYIWRRYDTSPGNGRYYKLNDPGYEWSKWCPSLWRVGQTYERKPLVSWFSKKDCSRLSARQETTYLTFAAIHPAWSGAADGLTFNDVIELHWKFTPGGETVERYWLAPRFGYVGWANNERFHYCVDLPQGRKPMVPEFISCLER